jgi:hypothetical protein
MKQGHPYFIDNLSAGQEFPEITEIEGHYRVHKSPSLDPVPRQLNPVDILTH